MADRNAAPGAAIGLALAAGVCCGVPWLLSIGLVASSAGWGFQNWLIAAGGLLMLAVAVAHWRRKGVVARQATPVDTPVASGSR